MRIKATKGKTGIGTEGKDATYVEAAGWGKYRWWRYVLGLMIILFAWMVAANFASALVALAIGESESLLRSSRIVCNAQPTILRCECTQRRLPQFCE